jgi:hypothetical protein
VLVVFITQAVLLNQLIHLLIQLLWEWHLRILLMHEKHLLHLPRVSHLLLLLLKLHLKLHLHEMLKMLMLTLLLRMWMLLELLML